MSGITVTTKINGDPVSFMCDADETLLDVLRNRLGLTGAKEGCSTGDCGACSVTVDGRLTCSCLVLGAEAEGKNIGTIEGMAQGESLHPLQSKFLEHAALQCGICTPGFLIAAKSLLVVALLGVVGTVTALVGYAGGNHFLDREGIGMSLSGDVLRSMYGSGLYLAGIGLFTVAVGFLLRHTAGTISIVCWRRDW